MRFVIVCSLLVMLFSGCRIYSSGVLKVAPETYSLDIEAPTLQKAKKIAIETGTQECVKLSREFYLVSFHSNEQHGEFDMIFRCLLPGDPELSKRPVFEPTPNVRIENR